MYNNEQQFIMSSGFTWLLTVKKLAKLQEIRIVGSCFFIVWLESPRVDFSVHPSFHLSQLHFHWSLLTATSPQSYPTFAIGIIFFLKTPPPPPKKKKENGRTSSWLSFVKTNRKQTRHFRFPYVTDCFHQNCHAPRIDRSDDDDDDDGQYQLTISINILAKLSHEA